MARRSYARRYAQAVFEIALERKELDRWQSDLEKIAGLGDDAEFMAFLESPKFRFEDKARLLSERLKDINLQALNLIYLLVARDRLGMIGAIAEEYRRLLNSYRGVEEAEVTTAIPLDDEDKMRLGEHLGAMVGRKVVLKSEVDTGIIGGFIARIGGKLLDGSTRSKLASLKRELGGAGR